MKMRFLGLLIGVMLSACSSDSGNSENTPIDTTVNATLDGVSLTISEVHSKYYPNQNAVEVTAKLSDGHRLLIRYGTKWFQDWPHAHLGYLKITDADGSNVYSTLYDMPIRYFLFKSTYQEVNQEVDIEFGGKIFANAHDSGSTFRHFQCRITSPYSETIDTPDMLSANQWYSITKRQDSASGAPIEIAFNNDEELQFRLRFEAVPAIGYYEFDNGTSTNITIYAFDETTETYVPFDCHGLMQITEVFQNPKRIKGNFTLTADGPSGFGYYTFNNGAFDISYN